MSRSDDSTNAYAILGVDPAASAEEVAAAYRRLALATHPDMNRDDPRAAEKFTAMCAAYKVLSDPLARARLDECLAAARAAAVAPASDRSPGDRVAAEAPRGHGRGRDGHPQVPADRRVRIRLRNGQRAGQVIRVNVERLDRCTACGGRTPSRTSPCRRCRDGRVLVLAEVRLRLPDVLCDGATLVLAGEGDAAAANYGGRGDLHVLIRTSPDRMDEVDSMRDSTATRKDAFDLEAELEAFARRREAWPAEEADEAPPPSRRASLHALVPRAMKAVASPASLVAVAITAGFCALAFADPEWATWFALAALVATAIGAYVVGLLRERTWLGGWRLRSCAAASDHSRRPAREGS